MHGKKGPDVGLGDPEAAHTKRWKAFQRLKKREEFEAWVKQQLARLRRETAPQSDPNALPKGDAADLLYVKGCGSYAEIVTGVSRQVVCCTLSDVEQYYGKVLFRVHRSYLVNLAQVEIVGAHHVVVGGMGVPVSSAYRPALRKALGIR